MVTQFEPKPNTFYVKKDLDDDVGVMPLYGDAYVGMSTTYDIVSNPNTTYYIGESTIISPDEYPYGEGTLSECHLSFYANDVSLTNSSVAAFMDIYSLKPNIDLTEGNLELFSGSAGTGHISVYSSTYDMGTPWFTEDFDGRNKFFMDAPSRNQPTYTRRQSDALWITKDNYMKAVMSTHEPTPGKHKSSWGTVAGILETSTQFLDKGEQLAGQGLWGLTSGLVNSTAGLSAGVYTAGASFVGSNVAASMMAFRAGSGVIAAGAAWTAAAGAGLLLGGVAATAAQPFGHEQIMLTKYNDGLYYLVNPAELKAQGKDSKMAGGGILSEGHSRGWWECRGAALGSAGYMSTSNVQYSSFDETYIAKCDQYNSMFSNVFVRGTARDIKAETVGDAGDNTKFLAYAFCNLVSDDVATDGNALRMKLFWENYSGSNYTDLEGANYFGWNSTKPTTAGTGHPLTQAVFCTTRGIPQPAMYDITTPSLSSSIAPEIEIRFKINQMPVAPYVWSGASYIDDEARELSRSFSIILHYAPLASSSTDPHITENLVDTGQQSGVSFLTGDAVSPITINFSKMKQGNKIDVLGCVQPYGGAVMGNCKHWSSDTVSGTNGLWLYYPPNTAKATARGLDKYHIQIPEGEWVTMRIKMWNPQNKAFQVPPYGAKEVASGSNIIAYFPDLKDENGEMEFLEVYNAWPMGPSGLWPSNLTLWTNNMRSINSTPGSEGSDASDPTHINNLYTKIDDNPDDDKIVDILVDNISFFGWGALTNNASVTAENGMGNLLQLPNATGIPMAVSNSAISVPGATSLGTGLNYYGGATHPIASYLSFGYDNTGSGVKNHKLLFNDFFTATPTTCQAIPHLKAGYFTSGNYSSWDGANGDQLGPLGWFTNLTIGVSSTAEGAGDNIQVGGDDNYIDGFKQKGLMGVSGAFTGWVRSGNPYVGAKILSVSADGTQITVDHTELFNTSQNERFVIESWGGMEEFTYTDPFAGTGFIGYTHEEFEAGSGSRGYVTPLTQVQAVQGDTVYLNQSVLYDDKGVPLAAPINSVAELNTFIDDDNFKAINNNARLIISPYKYWMNIAYVNATASGSGPVNAFGAIVMGQGYHSGGDHDITLSGTGDNKSAVVNATFLMYGLSGTPFRINYIVSGGTGYTVGEELTFIQAGSNNDATVILDGVDNGWGTWYNEVSGGGAMPLQPRAYNTVVAVSGGTIKGTTFNEFLFNDGLYSNPWDLDITDPSNPYINNTIDYGAGVVVEPGEDEPGINLARGGGLGYIQRDYLLSGQNYINLTNYIRVGSPQANDDFNFMVVPTFMSANDTFYSANVDTADGTNKAELIFGIKDKPPLLSDLRVSPSADFLKEGVDIYKATKGASTDINFRWEEEGGNVWQRMLYVDTETITNKYHKINFWAPLDASGSGVLPLGSGTSDYKYYTSPSDTTGTSLEQLISGTVTADITGFTGFGASFGLSGSLSASSSATSHGVAGLDEFTFTAYGIPSTPGPNGEQVMVWQTSGAAAIFNLRTVSGTNKMRVFLLDEDGDAVTVSGTTSFDCDGVQPIAAVVTFNKDRDYDNLKLYVNGALETTSGDDWTTGKAVRGTPSDSTIYLGSQKATEGFWNGFLEEITIHTKEFYVPPNKGQYALDTIMLPDKDGSNAAVYNSRLFVFDYHNIRGKGRTMVARSNQEGWRIAGV